MTSGRAGSPPTYVAEVMERSWNNGSSSVPGYLGDTFASFTEGEEETCRQYEDDPFESYDSAGSEPLESTWQLSSSHVEEQELEVLDPPETGKDLIRKWIALLKDNQTDTELAKTAVGPGDGEAQTNVTEESEAALGARRSFCATKINQLCHPPNSIQLKRHKRPDRRQGFASEKPTACDFNSVVLDQLLNRLCLQNIKETMKQKEGTKALDKFAKHKNRPLADAEMHHPSRCPHCQKKKAELAEDAFLRRQKTLLEKVVLEEKLEELAYTKDSLTLIGEIHKSLPKLSEDPRDIWQKLNERELKA